MLVEDTHPHLIRNSYFNRRQHLIALVPATDGMGGSAPWQVGQGAYTLGKKSSSTITNPSPWQVSWRLTFWPRRCVSWRHRPASSKGYSHAPRRYPQIIVLPCLQARHYALEQEPLSLVEVKQVSLDSQRERLPQQALVRL
jgi:hypothetical protein